MSIDFTRVLADADGETPLADELAMRANGGKRVDLTLGHAACHALCQGYPDEQVADADKFLRAALALRVRTAEAATLSVEDLALIKRLIARLYGPLVIYRAWSLLDPTTVLHKEEAA